MQTYHLHVAIKDAGDATAKAEVDTRDEERKVEFVDVKVDGDSIAFAEVRQFGEREFRIEYSGELKGKDLALTRSFGQRGGQESLATRDLPKPPPKEDRRAGGRSQNRSHHQRRLQRLLLGRHGG